MTASAATLPRLLAGVGGERQITLDEHHRRHGPLPRDTRRARLDLIGLVADSGLRGRGGAGFPAAAKLQAVRDARGASVVLANGAEGEPASAKDRLLLEAAPHLVLDGALLAADAVGAREVVVAVTGGAALRALERALAERAAVPERVAVTLARVPDLFIAGEETALVNHLGGGPLKPLLTPPYPSARGLRRRPTLVQNVETLAHLALIARHGPRWFRGAGTGEDPGSALITLSGAVAYPGVFEAGTEIALDDLLDAAGGLVEPARAVLVGGYFGDWIDAAAVDDLRLDDASLRRFGAKRGAGVIAVLPRSACGPAETARVLAYLAGQSAGQCGPCVNGLPAIAATVGRIVDGSAPADALVHLHRWQSVVRGRGACRLPDGVARFAASALAVFADEFADHHRHGRCDRCWSHAILPIPPPRAELAA
ncbi:MAG: NADH-ubiquinone oxidoreductase-F iron-sulfur binding region domain-containing protein [Solirubrobacteraceae bacterium]